MGKALDFPVDHLKSIISYPSKRANVAFCAANQMSSFLQIPFIFKALQNPAFFGRLRALLWK